MSCVVHRHYLLCGHSTGYIFVSIDLKFGQNVCFDKISDQFEFESYGSLSRLGQIEEIPLEATFLAQFT